MSLSLLLLIILLSLLPVILLLFIGHHCIIVASIVRIIFATELTNLLEGRWVGGQGRGSMQKEAPCPAMPLLPASLSPVPGAA